jgi:hypothetical protein
MALRLFVRDDDIGELTQPLQTFVETFLSRGIAVSYQIIPERLTQVCADYLLDAERRNPDLIEFGQHGLRHGMVLRGRQLKREFGPERSAAQQQADITEGLELLRQRLGSERAITVFTPPQHKFDANTITAAASVGHQVFSAACYPTARHRLAYALGRRLSLSSLRHHGISYHGGFRPEARLFEMSIAIAVDDGRSIQCRAPEIAAAIDRARRGSDDVGLMFHHAVYESEADTAELQAIADALAAYPQASFDRLGAMARSRAERLSPRAQA